ncbi:cation efflux family-domain-containing protein [Mycena alexandri]|uniref:Cation efflux family-domain-containing protein n=1 Tax=Mycena alexandri TaxID=1745969 RepID=A0AAD6WWT6_9AGAR|nr:cation efflux family-domain-containing protein [Mycena alexandri]
MPLPDAKTRNTISLKPRVFSSSLPSKQIPRIFLTSVLYATSLHAGKGLLDFDVGVFWVVMRVLACAGFGVLVWEGRTGQLAKRKSIEWSVLGTASLLVFVQQGALFTALYRLPSTRVVLFTHFSTLWLNTLLTTSTPRKTLAVALAWLLSIASDTQLSSANLWRYLPGYGALLVHSLTSSALDQTISILAPSLGSTFTIAASVLGASCFALPFYMFRTVVLDFPSTPVLPLISLAALPFLAFSLLFFSPITARSLSHLSFTPQHFMLSYPSTSVFAAIFGTLAFSQFPTWTDAVVAILLYFGMQPEKMDAFPAAPRTPTSRLIRSYLKTILSNPESRKIFYFLMLNMAYMLVQMLYGVWTNSLGLISDAIHMAFDCMAIGVGLFASVMATWEPNERFTYGYGRIETLSGFANGIFLILISIFIVFEAIQRLLEPPEMNTSQLLLVSSLGLAVNLFGMFAMGGHHHGGHSHSHGHSHGHSDNDSHGHSEHGSPPIGFDDHGHSHSSGHSHSHSPPASPLSPQAHSHSPPSTPSHSHSHSHGPPSPPAHSHSHSELCEDDHSDSHSPPLSPEDGHAHSHSHSPPSPEHSHASDSNHSHSHSNEPRQNGHVHGPPTPVSANPKRHFNGSSLHVHPKSPMFNAAELATPITPNYRFGVDEHYKTHHEDEHVPNLHNPVHAPSHEGHSHNMRGVFLHVMADTLGSVGVIISTLLIQFYGWTGFDPIASLFIAILIAASVVPLVMDTGRVLCLDISDRESTIDQALSELSTVEGLASFRAPRFWPKDATALIGSIHIQLAPSASSYDPSGPHSNQRRTYAKLDRVVERVDSLLRRRISGLEELTIQVEESSSGYT